MGENPESFAIWITIMQLSGGEIAFRWKIETHQLVQRRTHLP